MFACVFLCACAVAGGVTAALEKEADGGETRGVRVCIRASSVCAVVYACAYTCTYMCVSAFM
jgi:hypothetical protein